MIAKKIICVLAFAFVFPLSSLFCAPKVDVDITKMSPTFVYAQVFNMLIEPDEYEGKVIRIKGDFYVFSHEEADGKMRNAFSCIVQDATACCAQGLTFSLAGEHKYPEDYPAVGDEVIVQGTFRQFEVDGFSRIELVDCTLERTGKTSASRQ